MKHFLLLCVCTFSVFFLSCSNDEEEKLREKVRTECQVPSAVKVEKGFSKVLLEQYKDIELNANRKYCTQIKELVETDFERQLEYFEDEELGVIDGYLYMFKYLASSEQEWEDLQIQLSDKYFNTLLLQQDVQKINSAHVEYLKNLRSQFNKDRSDSGLPIFSNLNLPKSDIYLGCLSDHSGRNLAIEIGTTILDVLLGIVITWIVVNIIGYAVSGPVGCMVSIVSIVIMLIVSIICTSYNDGVLLDSLKEQKQIIDNDIDYNKIKTELDKNTCTFYENK